MNVRQALVALGSLALTISALGCGSDDETTAATGPAKAGPGPYGEIASNAAQAWPKAPSLPPLTREDVLSACGAWAACPSVEAFAISGFIERVTFCVQDLVLPSAERAIPMSAILTGANERAEYFVDCALKASTCEAMNACISSRLSTIYCEEDGCLAYYDYVVTCNGSVASLATSAEPVLRDCALALAECDPTGHTGCTDRPFSQCDPAQGTSDRCDGNIRLGCDGQGQVSYHDCSRLGGTCGTAPDGGEDCIYPTSLEVPCEGLQPTCTGTTLSACLLGDQVSVELASACP